MEAAAKNALFINSHEHGIKKLHFRPKQWMAQLPTTCSRCGKSNHTAGDCKFRDATCHACGKRGHIALACRSKQAKNFNPKPTGLNQPARSQHTNTVQTNETNDSESEEFYNLKLTTPAATSPIEVSLDCQWKLIQELPSL